MANGSISAITNANNGNANGGNLLYGDITAVLAKAAAVKAKGPFAWAMSPRTFYTRVLGMMDAQVLTAGHSVDGRRLGGRRRR